MIKYTIIPYTYNMTIAEELITSHYDVIEYFKRLIFLSTLDFICSIEIIILNKDKPLKTLTYFSKKNLKEIMFNVSKILQIW